MCMLNSKPVGGKIFTPDFENGVEVYVLEGHFSYFDDSRNFQVTPHSLWLVSDESLEEEILTLCEEGRQYREFEAVTDVMLGCPPVMEALPSLYLVADTFSYQITIRDWESYSINQRLFSSEPVYEELSGKPVMRVSRIDMSSLPEDETPLDYVSGYNEPDSLNQEGGRGWYSTISRESMRKLMALLKSVGAENAEEVEEYR